MDITPESLKKFHYRLFGVNPTEDQSSLYSACPSMRGYDDSALNPERFRAVVALAMAHTRNNPRVLLLAPIPHEKWVLEQFNETADVLFALCKKIEGPSETRINVAKVYGEMSRRIFIFGRLLQLPSDTQSWVSFGFGKEDPIPEWVKPHLLAV
jgi:hypothetical protein